MIGPVIQVHIFQFLGTHGIEVQIPSTTNPKRTSWVSLLERSIAKESEPFSTEMEQSRIEETHATHSKHPTNLVYYSKEVILVGKKEVE